MISWLDYACRSLLVLPGSLFALRQTLRYLDRSLRPAVLLAGLVGLALGLVISLQTRHILERTAGATDLLPTVLAVAIVLELGPIGAGLIVACRTGANLSAELASMRVTEQTDALEALGLSLDRELIGPRVLACMITVPLLMIFIAVTALATGYGLEQVHGEMTWPLYERRWFAELRILETGIALGKTILFGWWTGLAGCRYGLQDPSGSTGVGEAATNTVVAASMGVLAIDVLAAGLVRFLG